MRHGREAPAPPALVLGYPGGLPTGARHTSTWLAWQLFNAFSSYSLPHGYVCSGQAYVLFIGEGLKASRARPSEFMGMVQLLHDPARTIPRSTVVAGVRPYSCLSVGMLVGARRHRVRDVRPRL